MPYLSRFKTKTTTEFRVLWLCAAVHLLQMKIRIGSLLMSCEGYYPEASGSQWMPFELMFYLPNFVNASPESSSSGNSNKSESESESEIEIESASVASISKSLYLGPWSPSSRISPNFLCWNKAWYRFANVIGTHLISVPIFSLIA